jgi:hypothetical protein
MAFHRDTRGSWPAADWPLFSVTHDWVTHIARYAMSVLFVIIC